jgi:hypothetical protein
VKFSFLELFSKLRSKSWDSREQKHFYTFLVCIGISIFFWLTVKLSAEYYTTVSYKIRYTNLPATKLIGPEADSLIHINIHAKGFKLFTVKYLRSKSPIKINMQNVPVHHNRYSYGFYILSKDIKTIVQERLPFGVEISSISPDSMKFITEQIIQKKSPCYLQSKI